VNDDNDRAGGEINATNAANKACNAQGSENEAGGQAEEGWVTPFFSTVSSLTMSQKKS